MPVEFASLLDWTIQHLGELKEQGTRFVPVNPETLADLRQPPAPPALQVPSSRSLAAPEPVPARPPPPPSLATGPLPLPPPAPVLAPGPAPVATAVHSVEPPASVGFAPSPARSSPAKAAAFAELRQRALACGKCSNLVAARKHVVFGVGDIDAPLMFVGEAPGADEDQQGEPFVGAAGQLLTRIIQTMGLDRQSVYIANILKCRPDTPGQTSGNRKPTPDEMATCLPYLQAQIDLIQPKVLVALGATAVEGLLGKTVGITRLRGQWQTYRNLPLMPTYHPAYLLHNPTRSERRKLWEDMLQVMERLQMPVSKKQRAYFGADSSF